ncbi:uncharacterized protein DSM5745_09065 [Aspergillus mulundensis]|uniref:Uncharacterized protein n=1 Tax=Aspergillus mulundensis TaxID=1810919 RepID=A0A3D8QZI9_9EURO|nr:Uncharacterized protein DSM5745_09065 [Aspergillus mulundensis]RDW67199.1 Uncharacterized protein DSM5745_09065 [Aspergillus mulundensis]
MSSSNSTHPGHFHVPDSDGAIILMLGAVVFLTFALGMMSQLCEVPILFFIRRKQYWYEEDDDLDLEQGLGQTALNHRMSELEAETGAPRRSRPRPRHRYSDREPHRELGPESEYSYETPSRPTTRYGSIQQHMVEMNGIRKLVLVVDIDKYNRGEPSEASPDEYAEWFERWRQQQQREAEEAVSDEPLDEGSPLLGPWP